MSITRVRATSPGTAQGLTVIAAGFLPILAIVSLFPAIPSIIAHFSAVPNAQIKVPSAVSAPGLTIALLAFAAGITVDRFGRRRLLLIATGFYGLLGAAPFFLDNLDAIYASRLLLGVSEAAVLTTLNTLIADYWDEQGRRNWLTLQGMAGPFAASGVIFLSGYVTSLRWNASFLIYLVAVPIFIAVWLFLYEPEPVVRTASRTAPDAPFPWSGVLTFAPVTLVASALCYVFIINGASAWQEAGVQSAADIGRLSAVPSLFTVVGSGVYWILGKQSPRLRLTVFLALLGVGLGMIGFAHDWRGMIAGMVVQQTGVGMAIPTLIVWAQSYLPFEHRGRGMGVWTACFFFGQFVSPILIGGVRLHAGSMQGAFVAAGAFGLATAFVVNLALAGRRASPPSLSEV